MGRTERIFNQIITNKVKCDKSFCEKLTPYMRRNLMEMLVLQEDIYMCNAEYDETAKNIWLNQASTCRYAIKSLILVKREELEHGIY